MKKIFAHEVQDTQGVIIDVRSESEFFDGHIPGALNIPLLNDAERAEIGTLYVQKGPEIARQRGLEVVRPKLVLLLEHLGAASGVMASGITRPTESQWQSIFNI